MVGDWVYPAEAPPSAKVVKVAVDQVKAEYEGRLAYSFMSIEDLALKLCISDRSVRFSQWLVRDVLSMCIIDLLRITVSTLRYALLIHRQGCYIQGFSIQLDALLSIWRRDGLRDYHTCAFGISALESPTPRVLLGLCQSVWMRYHIISCRVILSSIHMCLYVSSSGSPSVWLIWICGSNAYSL